MRRCDLDRESAYRRRLRIATVFSVLLIALLFLSTENVPVEVLQFQFGWEGPTEILPEITIIPDNDPFEDLREESRYRATAALEIEELEEKGESAGARLQKEPRDEPEKKVTPDLDEELVRHYPAHMDVPYSEEYVILHMIKPDYPPEELDQGIEGDVTVELLINDGGSVEKAWVLMATGPRAFEFASLEAVRQFRFKPPIVDGRPSPMWIRFQIRFRIMT